METQAAQLCHGWPQSARRPMGRHAQILSKNQCSIGVMVAGAEGIQKNPKTINSDHFAKWASSLHINGVGTCWNMLICLCIYLFIYIYITVYIVLCVGVGSSSYVKTSGIY